MPLVQAFFSSRASMDPNGPAKGLKSVCMEIIPAGFHSKEGPIDPGDIDFIPGVVSGDHLLVADVVLSIEALDFPDRQVDLNDRCERIKEALEQLFPNYSFAVWGKLVKAGWAAPRKEVKPDEILPTAIDMSMPAAFDRATVAISALS